MTKFAAPFASWRANIIPTWPRTKRPPKRNSRKSTKPTKCWVIRKNGSSTISLERIGTSPADFNRHRNGAHSRRKADIINGAAMAAGSNSNLAEQGSVIFSKRFSAAAADVPLSADSADARQQRSAALTWKRTSWSLWRKRCTVRRGLFRCAGPVQIK